MCIHTNHIAWNPSATLTSPQTLEFKFGSWILDSLQKISFRKYQKCSPLYSSFTFKVTPQHKGNNVGTQTMLRVRNGTLFKVTTRWPHCSDPRSCPGCNFSPQSRVTDTEVCFKDCHRNHDQEVAAFLLFSRNVSTYLENYTTLVPLLVVLGITAIKDLVDDVVRIAHATTFSPLQAYFLVAFILAILRWLK